MKSVFLLSLVLLTSCSTHRLLNDKESEAITGVRTRANMACFAPTTCLKDSIAAAKKECTTEKKKYEYVSNHSMFLKYKCI